MCTIPRTEHSEAPARAPPKPSVLWNLARVLLPVTLPAVEAAPAPTAGPGVRWEDLQGSHREMDETCGVDG